MTSDGSNSGIQLITEVDNNAPTLEVSKSNSFVPIQGSAAGQTTSLVLRVLLINPLFPLMIVTMTKFS